MSDLNREPDSSEDPPAEPPVADAREEPGEESALANYRPVMVPPAERIGAAADTMGEFNRLLWQMVKSIWITTLGLIAFLILYIAYLLVKMGVFGL